MKPFTNGFHQAGVTVLNIFLSSSGDIILLPNEGLLLSAGQINLPQPEARMPQDISGQGFLSLWRRQRWLWVQRQYWAQKGGNRVSVLAGRQGFANTKPKKWQGGSCRGARTSQDLRTD